MEKVLQEKRAFLNSSAIYRSSHLELVCNICVGIYFLIKVFNFIKKETPTQEFSCGSWEFIKNTFFAELLRATASIFDISYSGTSLNRVTSLKNL